MPHRAKATLTPLVALVLTSLVLGPTGPAFLRQDAEGRDRETLGQRLQALRLLDRLIEAPRQSCQP